MISLAGNVIQTEAVLGEVNRRLQRLLSDLSVEDWARPTVHPNRDVKDLAAHLLHGSLRRLTSMRDRYHMPGPALDGWDDVVAFIQADNRRFMDGMRPISPEIIIEMLSIYDPAFELLAKNVDPAAIGLGVMWAGESRSPNWFDMAREYTEKWHHQQQIRDAVGAPLLNEPALLGPALDIFVRGLPYAYRSFAAPEGSAIAISVVGDLERDWVIRRENGCWSLWEGRPTTSFAALSIPADVAWRLWTKSMPAGDARSQVEAQGEPAALEPLMQFVAIMA